MIREFEQWKQFEVLSNHSSEISTWDEDQWDFLIQKHSFTIEEEKEISSLKDLNQCKLFTIDEEEEIGMDFNEAVSKT